MMLKAKQKGFTLLELLVVITLLAILSVGALVAYDGLTEKAQASATANNTAAVDRAIRQYKVIAQTLPDQWDNLAGSGVATGYGGLASATQLILADLSGAPLVSAVAALEEAGIESLQQAPDTAVDGVVPNLQHNEGATSGASAELGLASVTNLAILAYNGRTTYAGNVETVAGNQRINKLNDDFEDDASNVIVALGFGHDAAHSTTNSKVAIAQAATYTSKDVDPSKHYARYIGLFHVAEDETADNSAPNAATMEYHEKAHFVGIIDPEGNGIDDNIAEAIANDN